MSKCTYTYALLSLAFVMANVFTLSNLTPWIDEVMMLDTPYNAAFHGSWSTTAWYRVAGQYPFSTYPPLYQVMAAAWMRIFGGSLVTVRSMNLLLMILLGGVCLRLMKRIGISLTPWTTALFACLLWGTSEMAWMYRNGRPDMLNALLVALTLLSVEYDLMSKTMVSRIAVVFAAALLMCSGIQAAVYLCALWMFFFMVGGERRKECLRLLVTLLSGLSLGMICVALFMMIHGRWLAFVTSIVQYSATLSGFALTVLPWVGDSLGVDVAPYTQKLLLLTTKTGLGQRLLSMTEFHSFLVLSAMTLIAYISYFHTDLRVLRYDRGFLCLLLAFFAPVMLVVAGRFTTYYRWMAYLPLLFSIVSIAARCQLWQNIFCVAAVVLSLLGIKSMASDEHCNYENLCSFVQRQHFRLADVVVCPFSVFYEMKPVCDTCLFVGVFPTEFIHRVDYVIEASDGDEFDEPISNYVNKLKTDSTVVLTAIDHCEHPSLTLYQVKSSHE